MGGPELANEILDRFFIEGPTRLQQSYQCLDSAEYLNLCHHLHRICSDAGWLGAKDVQALASQMEVVAHTFGPNSSTENLDSFRADLDRLSEYCYQATISLEQEKLLLRSNETESPLASQDRKSS
jgi:HPt (histidine-containing phosphotransfer) domain-containing protein